MREKEVKMTNVEKIEAHYRNDYATRLDVENASLKLEIRLLAKISDVEMSINSLETRLVDKISDVETRVSDLEIRLTEKIHEMSSKILTKTSLIVGIMGLVLGLANHYWK